MVEGSLDIHLLCTAPCGLVHGDSQMALALRKQAIFHSISCDRGEASLMWAEAGQTGELPNTGEVSNTGLDATVRRL